MKSNLSQRLKALVDSRRTVFRTGDMTGLWRDNPRTAVITAQRMVAAGLLVQISRGYYALRQDYDCYELANKLIQPSYVSFDSALFLAGMNFQVRRTVYSVAGISRAKTADGRKYEYHAMKDKLFSNSRGIERLGKVILAAPERAVLDGIYFGLSVNVDNWDKINKTYLKRLAKMYPKSVQDKAGKIYDSA